MDGWMDGWMDGYGCWCWCWYCIRLASYMYQECVLSSGGRALESYSFKPTDDVWSMLWIQLGYLAGLQVALYAVLVFVDYSDESGSNAVTHDGAPAAASSPKAKGRHAKAKATTLGSSISRHNSTDGDGDVESGGTRRRRTPVMAEDTKRQPLLAVAAGVDDDDDNEYGDGEGTEAILSAPKTALEFRNLCYSVKVGRMQLTAC